VDRASGQVLWKMGGTAYSKDNPIYVTVSDPFYRQHDARFQSWTVSGNGGKGQISVFDDQSYKPSPARAAIFDVLVTGREDAGDADGGGSHAASSWAYKGAANTMGEGSFRISPDGSRVICWGISTNNPVFTEVDAEGHDLLDFSFTDHNPSYRTVKVPLSAFDLGLLRSTAGRQ